jgi:hypothetical protein
MAPPRLDERSLLLAEEVGGLLDGFDLEAVADLPREERGAAIFDLAALLAAEAKRRAK